MTYNEFVEIINMPSVMIIIGVACFVIIIIALELHHRWTKRGM